MVTDTDPSDDSLLAAARAGDRHALEALLERHQAQVYRFGMKMCRDPEDAKDVLQDTLLAMARGVRDFRGASSLSTWLYTIARSFCIKKRRRSKFAPDEERSLDSDQTTEAKHLPDPGRQSGRGARREAGGNGARAGDSGARADVPRGVAAQGRRGPHRARSRARSLG